MSDDVHGIAPPFTYETLTQTLAEQPDLVTLYAPRPGLHLFGKASWQKYAASAAWNARGKDALSFTAQLWACLLHTATDTQIELVARTWVAADVASKPWLPFRVFILENHTAQLRRLFLEDLHDTPYILDLAKLIKFTGVIR